MESEIDVGRLITGLGVAWRHLREATEEAARRRGLSWVEYRVLLTCRDLCDDGEPPTLQVLAGELTGHRDVSRLTQALGQMGYVHRRADPADRRRTVIAMAPRGEEVLASISDEVARRSPDRVHLARRHLWRMASWAGEARKEKTTGDDPA